MYSIESIPVLLTSFVTFPMSVHVLCMPVYTYTHRHIQSHTVDGIVAPKEVHILIPGTCESVTLQDKRNVADVVKLMVLL